MGSIIIIAMIFLLVKGILELEGAWRNLTPAGWRLLTRETEWVVWSVPVIIICLFAIFDKDSRNPTSTAGWLMVAAFAFASGLAAKGWVIRSRLKDMETRATLDQIRAGEAPIFKAHEAILNAAAAAPQEPPAVLPMPPVAQEPGEFAYDPARFSRTGGNHTPAARPVPLPAPVPAEPVKFGREPSPETLEDEMHRMLDDLVSSTNSRKRG